MHRVLVSMWGSWTQAGVWASGGAWRGAGGSQVSLPGAGMNLGCLAIVVMLGSELAQAGGGRHGGGDRGTDDSMIRNDSGPG